jgi:methylenetetrahydrofolate dehydrogenase (NADP+)/methenyltetrahydrofolate cyclohydrolase
MSSRLLEGRPVADAIWRGVDERAAPFTESVGRPPTLAYIAGEDESALAYARQIERQLTRHGLRVLRSAASVDELSSDPQVDGILLLAPLPIGADPLSIDPSKDVDGQHPVNLGRLAQRRRAFAPATALGGLRLLQHYGIALQGARVVVVGRSPVVGMPLALLLVDADATVTICHSRTADLAAYTREAEILCVAAGKPGLIGPEHVRPGAVVVDFGTPGDVQETVREVAAAVTPVPGGTGPTTVAILAEQTVQAAEDIETRRHAN